MMKFQNDRISFTTGCAGMCFQILPCIFTGCFPVFLIVEPYPFYLAFSVSLVNSFRSFRCACFTNGVTLPKKTILPGKVFDWLRSHGWTTFRTNSSLHGSLLVGILKVYRL